MRGLDKAKAGVTMMRGEDEDELKAVRTAVDGEDKAKVKRITGGQE